MKKTGALFKLFIMLGEYIIPQVRNWEKAYKNYNRSQDQIGKMLNGVDDELDWYQANNDYTYWKFIMFTEECKVLFWLGLLIGSYWSRLYCTFWVLLVTLVLLVILFLFKKDIY